MHAHNLARSLVESGCQVVVHSVNRKNRTIDKKVDDEIGYEVHYLSSVLGLLRDLRGSDGDILHFHSYRDIRIAFGIVLGRVLTPDNGIIFTPHAILPSRGSMDRLRKSLYDLTMGRLSLRIPDRVIALTGANREEVLTCGGRQTRIEIVPNGIRIDSLRNMLLGNEAGFRNRYSIPNDYILFVGRLAWHKGLEFLIDAMKSFRESKINLVIVGEDAGMRRTVEDMIAKYDLTGVIRILGPLNHHELFPAYRDSIALVLPSSYEGLPTVVLEALAMGKVVISTSSAASEIIQDGQNGYLVDYGNTDQLVSRIRTVIEDRGILREMEANAVQTAMNYDWRVLVGRVIDLYGEVLRAKQE